ncbi:MAG TPA: hypothetical protein PKC69_15390 [Chitinophagaceae bacterium]|nr:hypothetical protein [Chitinophagaceae bacterium]
MRHLILLAAIVTISLSASRCGTGKSKSTAAPEEGLYKGKLEIKALCMNYTIRIMDGSTDTSLVAASWTDESSGKSYENVFGLGSPCTFPDSIAQGDEFYFKIDTSTVQNCAVCMAYYPTPPKRLSIKIIDKK